jgi:RsmE family RNA methyltransferase
MDEIIFRPSERSVIRQWNTNKAERLTKIAREAVEQSRGRVMPKIEFATDIGKILKNKNLYLKLYLGIMNLVHLNF